MGLSAAVQSLQLASIWCILASLSIGAGGTSYLFVFLVSSIVSVVPLTIGGIGSRELTFYYGAELLSLNENASIGVSMAFFFITAFVSVLGAYYHIKRPVLTVAEERRADDKGLGK